MRKKILVLAGGYSKERNVSLDTGKEVYKSLKKKIQRKDFGPKSRSN